MNKVCLKMLRNTSFERVCRIFSTLPLNCGWQTKILRALQSSKFLPSVEIVAQISQSSFVEKTVRHNALQLFLAYISILDL